jgi:hypothetical protein
VLPGQAHLPDAVIGFVPVVDDDIGDLLHERPMTGTHGVTAREHEVHQLGHRAERVELHLVLRGVADADGAAAGVARQLGDRALGHGSSPVTR